MSAATNCLRSSDDLRVRQIAPYYGLHQRESKIKWIAFALAVLLHIALLSLNVPEPKVPLAPKTTEPPLISRVRLPPPPPEPPRERVRSETTLEPRPYVAMPVPGPTEPVPEKPSTTAAAPVSVALDFILDVIEPPPSAGPFVPDGVHVTLPVRIEDSFVKPEYPELGRAVRTGARVVLQAVILGDGSVGEIVVLQCTRPNLGFEEAAIDAVRQWRYRPAMQAGRTVDVYFTVVVDFSLQ